MTKNDDSILTAMALITVSLLFGSLLTGCTANDRAKHFGGSMEIEVPCDQSVFDVTWKEGSLWYATTPTSPGWVPETKTFHEVSQLGVVQGAVTLKESFCPPVQLN